MSVYSRVHCLTTFGVGFSVRFTPGFGVGFDDRFRTGFMAFGFVSWLLYDMTEAMDGFSENLDFRSMMGRSLLLNSAELLDGT